VLEEGSWSALDIAEPLPVPFAVGAP
jgi:hypothetical protein